MYHKDSKEAKYLHFFKIDKLFIWFLYLHVSDAAVEDFHSYDCNCWQYRVDKFTYFVLFYYSI